MITDVKATLMSVLVKQVRVGDGELAVAQVGDQITQAGPGTLVTIPADGNLQCGPDADMRADPNVAASLETSVKETSNAKEG